MIEPDLLLPRFRSHIFRSFVFFSLVVITGAALLVFATNKFTEDATLRQVLAASESTGGLLVGELREMPVGLQDQLSALPEGLFELDGLNSEIQVRKVQHAGVERYSLLQLDADSVVTPFFLWLIVGTVAATGLAVIFSLRLARRFSGPVETIIQRLSGDLPLQQDHQGIHEFNELLTALEAHRQEQALRLAQEANFAQSVSHELRTPITVVMGAVELLLADAPTTGARARLLRIQRANNNMRWTVEALLSLTRAEQSAFTGDMNFAEALHASVEQAKARSHAGVEITTRINGYPASRHEWAPLLVALQTLLDNAVTHTETGSVQIVVGPELASVNDTGAGLSSERLAQVRNNATEPGRLGFAMVHRICERCDWALQIESDNEGTRVVLDFLAHYARPIG